MSDRDRGQFSVPEIYLSM